MTAGPIARQVGMILGITLSLAALTVPAAVIAQADPSPTPKLEVLAVTFEPEVRLGSAQYKFPMSTDGQLRLENSETVMVTIQNGPRRDRYVWVKVDGLPWVSSMFAGIEGAIGLVDENHQPAGSMPSVAPGAMVILSATPGGTSPIWVRFEPIEPGAKVTFVWKLDFVSLPRRLAVTVSVATGGPGFVDDGPELVHEIWKGTGTVTVVDDAGVFAQ